MNSTSFGFDGSDGKRIAADDENENSADPDIQKLRNADTIMAPFGSAGFDRSMLPLWIDFERAPIVEPLLRVENHARQKTA